MSTDTELHPEWDAIPPGRQTRACLRNAMETLRRAREAALREALPSVSSMCDHALDATADALAELDDLTRKVAS